VTAHSNDKAKQVARGVGTDRRANLLYTTVPRGFKTYWAPQIGKDHVTYRLLEWAWDKSDDYVFQPSVFAAEIGVSTRTAQRAFKRLAELGLWEMTSVASDRKTTRYRWTDRVWDGSQGLTMIPGVQPAVLPEDIHPVFRTDGMMGSRS
jgi:hypothetical protein